MDLRTLPRHLPKRFFSPVGFRKDGRPIMPIAGGSEPSNQGGQQDNSGQGDQQGQQDGQQKQEPEEARDEHGAGLGFPKDTRTEDMTDAQKVNYWRNQSKVQQRQREQAERDLQAEKQRNTQQNQNGNNGDGSGTVREQQADDSAIRASAAQDAAMATIRTTLALRGMKADDIDDTVDLLSPAKFVTADHKVDSAKVTAFVEKTAGRGTGGGSSDFGAGRREEQGRNKAEAGRQFAEKRFGNARQGENRGALGGLRK